MQRCLNTLIPVLALLLLNSGHAADTANATKKPQFNKIANDGAVLPDSAVLGSGSNDWACTRDNSTGLVWEVKTTSGLRSQSHDYTWFSSKATTNGGSVGTGIGGSCEHKGRCDTEKFVADVNKVSLCGAKDWRVPTIDELSSIVDANHVNPAIDLTYFPNTRNTGFWSSSAGAHSSNYAWYLIASGGYVDFYYKYSPLQIRLVRGGV